MRPNRAERLDRLMAGKLYSDEARSSVLGPRAALLLVAVIFVGLTSVVALKTPAWESDDEVGHVQNIETLVSGHWYRIPSDVTGELARANPTGRYDIDLKNELHQAPLYYLLLAGFQRLAGQPPHGVDPGPANLGPGGAYLHHSAAQHRFLLLLRFPNVFLGLLTVLVTFMTAALVSADPWTPVVAAAFVAFVPRFVFGAAFVSNDNLVNLLGAVLAFTSVRCMQHPTVRWMAAAGALLGLLVITKLSAAPAFLILFPIVLAHAGWRRRLRAIAVALVATLAVCGWYLVQNQVRYGSLAAVGASRRYLTAIGGLGTFDRPYVVTDPLRLVFIDVPSRIWRDFWYESGIDHAYRWPVTTDLVFWVALAFAMSGLLIGTQTGWRVRRAEHGEVVALTTLTVTGFLSVWIVAFSAATYEARYAFLGVPALGCLVALGVQRWRPPIRFLIPLLGLCGTVVASQQNVLAVHWNA
jgi:hypothetical protein